jgi:hypothetical protein
MTHSLVVSGIERSKAFYRDLWGATVYREYGGTSVVLNSQGTWLLVVKGGGPTEDKPDVTFEPPSEHNRVSHAMAIRWPSTAPQTCQS